MTEKDELSNIYAAMVRGMEKAIASRRAYNGLEAIRDAAICRVVMSNTASQFLDLDVAGCPSTAELQALGDALYELEGLGF